MIYENQYVRFIKYASKPTRVGQIKKVLQSQPPRSALVRDFVWEIDCYCDFEYLQIISEEEMILALLNIDYEKTKQK
jgi:hypothetical protein